MNPFESLENRLDKIDKNFENLLLAIKPKDEENKLHSVKSLSLIAGVSELTIRNWIKEGKIQAKKIGGRILIEQTQFAKGLEEVKSLKYKR